MSPSMKVINVLVYNTSEQGEAERDIQSLGMMGLDPIGKFFCHRRRRRRRPLQMKFVHPIFSILGEFQDLRTAHIDPSRQVNMRGIILQPPALTEYQNMQQIR